MVAIENPGAVIAALPPWLGYTPRRSMVLILLDRTDVPDQLLRATHVRRCDLLLPDGAIDAQSIAMAAFDLCAYFHPDLLCAVIIDDDLHTREPRDRYDYVIALLRERATLVWGVPLMDAWATPEVAAGQPWWSVVHADIAGQAFERPQPGHSPSPLDLTGPQSGLAAQVAAQLTERRAEPSPAADADLRSRHRDQLRVVLRLVDSIAAHRWPSAQDVVELTLILDDDLVRDCCHALATTRRAVAALDLWTLTWQALPPGRRTQAALLTASAAILADKLWLAGTALRTILVDEPGHPHNRGHAHSSAIHRSSNCGRWRPPGTQQPTGSASPSIDSDHPSPRAG
ncbi:DUF4192 domain-containing protein [Nocardia sp. CDC159]|uniref:DUF4192 domain-containing protein n=1 Tax=Nocardia pulmonis TaxID=2951408 RepID=A0A9X2E5K3_9NOCA|nr:MULTISPECIES: DUF4192 domain-containing protein [Nocardia]MCM6774527.1 DUF4192 domain-containing protein [Nocardia pulmonis]MCM6787407.1 DUF4192 domain-containing protein [Nocardia sp. CDC159]